MSPGDSYATLAICVIMFLGILKTGEANTLWKILGQFAVVIASFIAMSFLSIFNEPKGDEEKPRKRFELNKSTVIRFIAFIVCIVVAVVACSSKNLDKKYKTPKITTTYRTFKSKTTITYFYDKTTTEKEKTKSHYKRHTTTKNMTLMMPRIILTNTEIKNVDCRI